VEARSRQLEFRVDSSNRDTRLARNRIRTVLLPVLEKEFNPAIVHLLKDFATRARDDENFLQQAAAERARPWRIREGSEERIAIRPLVEYPPAIERRVLRDMILSAGGTRHGITSHHIETLRQFAEAGRSGQVLTLPGGLAARKEFEWLVVSAFPKENSSAGFQFRITPPEEVAIPQLNLKFRFFVAENVGEEASEREYNHSKGGCIDLDRLADSLVLRNWQPGDRFQPLGSGRTSKLKELFLKYKIPLNKRRVWPVLCSGEEVVWVYRFPPAQRVLASGSSTRTLIVEAEALDANTAG
jgi:tRNA(Ile)-lysidine synthase